MNKYRKRMLLWCIPLVACCCGMPVARHFGRDLIWAVCFVDWLACVVMVAYNCVMFIREK